MSTSTPLWINEAEVVELMCLPQAIEALERGLALQAQGGAYNMGKTHVTWGNGHTLHALGASFHGAGIAGTKTWAHTAGGATPLLILWDSETGALRAVIETFALGQMRTGAVSAVATRWMARPDAATMALIGTGKQAMTQVAAVAAVRPLRQVRIFSPTPQKRRSFIDQLAAQGFDFEIVETASAREAAAGSAIVTLITRAREPFLHAHMAEAGSHINAVGAITPERQEFAQDVFERASFLAADDPAALAYLSREFMDRFGDPGAAWSVVQPLSRIVAEHRHRPADCDLSLFKAMGMGLADVALGLEVLEQASAGGSGRPLEFPKKVTPRLHRMQAAAHGAPR